MLNKIFKLLMFIVVMLSLNYEAEAQQYSYETFFDNLTAGDTTETFSVPSGAKTMFITVRDSAQTGDDTIVATTKQSVEDSYGNVSATYSLLGSRDIAGANITAFLTTMVPGNGVTRTYEIDLARVPPGDITLFRTNYSTDANYLPVTRIKVWFK